jgi:hypothetical protein
MRRANWAIFVAAMSGLCLTALAQTTTSASAPATGPAAASVNAPAQPQPAADQAPAAAGGKLHGVVKAGSVPLPGVTVTAQNTLTGKRYSTTSDITGAWSMTIPQNGRYVVRTQFAAFAVGSGEAVLNATSHDQTVNFALQLASRAAAEEQRQAASEAVNPAASAVAALGSAGVAQAIQQLTGTGAENVSLTSALSADTEAAGGQGGASGAELPTIATNSDFSGESVAITGQSGQVSPIAGVDMDRLRDALQTYQAQNGGDLPGGGGLFGGGGGGLFIGGAGAFAGGGGFGGPGGGGGRGGGGFGGGRGNFRGFNPAQPHGSVQWNGTNSALNAQPFSLRGQTEAQPPYGTNSFTASLITEPYLPGLTKPSGKDTIFFSLGGSRNSNLTNQYATLPTAAELGGDFSAAGLPTIYDPTTGLPFANNKIPSGAGGRITGAAQALAKFFPAPNIAGTNALNNYNYYYLTTSQSNSNQAGVRYMRTLGKAQTTQRGGRGGGGGGGRGGRNAQNQGLRQSISLNYNWSGSASDIANLVPSLGGKSGSDSNSIQAGYTLGYHRLTSISNLSWNRSSSHTINYFTDTANNIGLTSGIVVPNDFALNYGLPNIGLSSVTGLSETQPSFSVSQTIALTQTVSWIHGKHNFRFGGDYRRVHRDFLAGSNATGNFTFTGLFTENPAQPGTTGSSIADFLLGLPQSTSLNASLAKSYLRDNVYDAYAQDDWRAFSAFTLSYGLRYEYYAPYFEKYGHLADVLTNPAGGFTTETEVTAGRQGLPGSLVNGWHKAFAPRLGIAYRVPKIKQMVVRAGFGMNYTVGEYAGFANLMAHQPPFTNEQTNEESVGNTASTACVQTNSCFTLANGFPAAATVGNYALDPHYTLPYVMAWNLDIQKTLPLGIVMNLGYNGSRANHLDVKSAPRATPLSPGTDPTNLVFNYDQALAFSKFEAATMRVNKRLQKGISMGANYQYSHSIDDSSSVNGGGGSVAQNWQNLNAEEGNSTFDVRHKVSGTYLLELPFGPDKRWITTGAAAHIMEGFSMSGSYTFASGSYLTPTYTATTAGVACGTAGALRANRVAGVSVTAGGGSLKQWFNPAAYSLPAATPGYCNAFGNASRDSIQGPGTVQNNMSLSKTVSMGDTRSMEIRASINNVFNTVQYTGVNTTVGTPTFGQVSSTGSMRSFQFRAQFRY